LHVLERKIMPREREAQWRLSKGMEKNLVQPAANQNVYNPSQKRGLTPPAGLPDNVLVVLMLLRVGSNLLFCETF
jgi:hypothetical protein